MKRGKRKLRALLASLAVDGNMKAAAARNGVSYACVRYRVRRYPEFEEARDKGATRAREFKQAEKAREVDVCARRLERALVSMRQAQTAFAKGLAGMSWEEVKSEDLRLDILAERVRCEKGILAMVKRKAGIK